MAKTVPVVSREVRTSESGSGLALLDPCRGRVYVCNNTGRRVWEALTATRSLRAVAAELSAEYGVAEEQVLLDIDGFVDGLSRHGLLANPAGL